MALGGFLAALHQAAPPLAPRNPVRGIPLADRAPAFDRDLTALGQSVDQSAIRRRWEVLVDTPGWSSPPVWVHGDVHPLNLLVDDGRLSAVIDFGDLTAGDPASDLAVAWMLFSAPVRDELRAAAGVDDATWRRALGWALCLGVAFANGDERVAAIGRRTIEAALRDPL